MHFKRIESDSGFTLLNLLATLSLLGILMIMAASNVRTLENPLEEASAGVAHHLRLARSRAISQTTTIEVSPSNDNTLVASLADECTEESRDAIANLTFNLPEGASFDATDWEVCFTQRGLANADVIFEMSNEEGRKKIIQVALGGGTRISE